MGTRIKNGLAKLNGNLVAGILFIMFFTIWAMFGVGVERDIESCSQPYSWDLPVQFFLILVIPLVLGYHAGKAKR